MPTLSPPLVFAHRGASAVEPDNTLAAFAAAVAGNADGIEMDVRRTADGVLVLHHDAAVADGRPLVDLDLAELRRRHPEVPTLDEMLDVVGDLLINLEIKNKPGEPDHDPAAPVADDVVAWVQRHRSHRRIIVTSFDAASIARVRAVDTEVITGHLLGRVDDLPAAITATVAAGHSWIVPSSQVLDVEPAAKIDLAHQHGLRVMVWTMDDPERMVTMAAAGIDAVITNDPALASATLT